MTPCLFLSYVVYNSPNFYFILLHSPFALAFPRLYLLYRFLIFSHTTNLTITQWHLSYVSPTVPHLYSTIAINFIIITSNKIFFMPLNENCYTFHRFEIILYQTHLNGSAILKHLNTENFKDLFGHKIHLTM